MNKSLLAWAILLLCTGCTTIREAVPKPPQQCGSVGGQCPSTSPTVVLGPGAGTNAYGLVVTGTDSNYQVGFFTGLYYNGDGDVIWTATYAVSKDHISHCTATPINMAASLAFDVYPNINAESETTSQFTEHILTVGSITFVQWNVVCP